MRPGFNLAFSFTLLSRRTHTLRQFNAVWKKPYTMYDRRRSSTPNARHPYLSGNFAPLTETHRLIGDVQLSGTIPKELHGGMYVRNGGNPITNSDLGRDAHWFDGDGMLSGVWLDCPNGEGQEVVPKFVNKFVLTDVLLSSMDSRNLRTPILPSIATLVNPVASLLFILWRILRSALLVLLSHMPGSPIPITRISVANTGIIYHDGRALATCESGPPIRVQLPNLETVGWFDGNTAEGEPAHASSKSEGFGGTGLLSWMREWTTGHPKIDLNTGEMILFHCNFIAPYVHYSLIPDVQKHPESTVKDTHKLMNAPVPGCSGGKLMHDFGVSRFHTVILDLPLGLTPFNLLKNNPIVAYEPDKPARFGVFPRYDPSSVRWFETTGCCIFHTANTWDELDEDNKTVAVNILACRLTSSSLVFSAGNIAPPPHPNRREALKSKRMSFFAKYEEDKQYRDVEMSPDEKTPLIRSQEVPYAGRATWSPETAPSPPISNDDEEQCRLYYYRFDLDSTESNRITHQYALSVIPFEFPTVSPAVEMTRARYIYGCSTTNENFGAALGKATKIDALAKIDTRVLFSRAEGRQPVSITGSVDNRSIREVMASADPHDPIKIFSLPEKHYAQEARFVPREKYGEDIDEDDGFLLFYVFDESQLDENGECRKDSKSELWILDAKGMKEIIAKIALPTRVPYGLHGNWFTEKQIREQREVERLRSTPATPREGSVWMKARNGLIGILG